METTSARQINALCDRLCLSAKSVFGSHLRGAILKGSAFRGDFLTGYSDLDLHFFVDDAVMSGPRRPRRDYAVRFQEEVGCIDPEPFGTSAFSVFFLSWAGFPWDWPGAYPLPGTYRLLFGEMPPGADQMTAASHIDAAHNELRCWAKFTGGVIEQVVDKPDSALPKMVRLIGTPMKMFPYNIATLLTQDPKTVLTQPPSDIWPMVEPLFAPLRPFSTFFSKVREWPVSPAVARGLLCLADETADRVWDWYTSNGHDKLAPAQPRNGYSVTGQP